jgi:hypothetical protein
MYQLRFKLNKKDYEIVGTYSTASLAYGMRKKLSKEQPTKYPISKLYVEKI